MTDGRITVQAKGGATQESTDREKEISGYEDSLATEPMRSQVEHQVSGQASRKGPRSSPVHESTTTYRWRWYEGIVLVVVLRHASPAGSKGGPRS